MANPSHRAAALGKTQRQRQNSRRCDKGDIMEVVKEVIRFEIRPFARWYGGTDYQLIAITKDGSEFLVNPSVTPIQAELASPVDPA
jgi:hypothetical protein